MTTLTMNVINRNDNCFQVIGVSNHLTWIPYKMVTVVDETPVQASVSDVGSITFEISDALARRLNLVDGGHTTYNADPTEVPSTTTAPLREWVPSVHQAQPSTAIPQLSWKFTVDTMVIPTTGRYTVVLTAEDDYVTLRLSEWENRPGFLIVSFLKGPDNANDYMPFAEYKLDGRHFRTWKNFRHPGFARYLEAARVLFSLDENGQYEAGEAYALRSSNCCKCGRDLTVAKSITRGMGPDCWMRFAPMDELRRMVEAMRA